MAQTIGAIISHKKATLNELQTVYGLEDMYDILEVILVDNYNTKILTAPQKG